jgi:hypothetical protein
VPRSSGARRARPSTTCGGTSPRHGITITYSGVYQLLQSRVYLGELHFGKFEPNLTAHEPIVDRGTWDAVQRARSRRAQAARASGCSRGSASSGAGRATRGWRGRPRRARRRRRRRRPEVPDLPVREQGVPAAGDEAAAVERIGAAVARRDAAVAEADRLSGLAKTRRVDISRWGEWTLASRREVVRDTLGRVTVGPGRGRGRLGFEFLLQ